MEWLNMEIGGDAGNGILQIDLNHPSSLHILNEEDIPHILLNSLTFTQIAQGLETYVKLNLQNTVNDLGIRDINSNIRKCYFPQDKSETKYKYYSYSVCVTECLKRIQLKMCNCTHYNMIYDGKCLSICLRFMYFTSAGQNLLVSCGYES